MFINTKIKINIHFKLNIDKKDNNQNKIYNKIQYCLYITKLEKPSRNVEY